MLAAFAASAALFVGGGAPPPCGEVSTRLAPLEAVSRRVGPTASAFADPRTCEIVVSEGWWATQSLGRRCALVAHEVAHLYGYQHEATGLMAPIQEGDLLRFANCRSLIVWVQVCLRGQPCYSDQILAAWAGYCVPRERKRIKRRAFCRRY